MNESIDVVIVAAGSGTRLGYAMPKAFVPLNKRPLLSHSVDTFLTHPSIRNVILVIPEQMINPAREQFSHSRIKITTGGEQRWNSVQNGIRCSDAEWVLVHDAARPFVTNKIIDSVIVKRLSFNCVITATPVVDTIRIFEKDVAKQTIDRESLVRVGTPQLFKRALLLFAFDKLSSNDPIPTDEAMIMQNAGVQVGIAWGDPNNFKITTPEDLELAEALLTNRAMR